MTSSSSSSPEIQPAPPVDSTERFSYKHATHEDVLEDLSSRFLLNLPDEELSSLERICFQVEQAHWFYEDFIREENPKFPSLPLKKFSAMLFHACPLLHQWSHDHEQAFNTFMQYKTRVPVCGAIMLNDTWEKCILVKGWKSSSGWGFPKGKINEDEPPHDCAIREVLEETGYNLAGQLDPQNVIQMSIKEQLISLYIVPGVPEDYLFRTRTRKEISRIEWFKLTDLPTWKRNKAAPGKFYLISPFIGALKTFINERKPHALNGRGRKHVHQGHVNGTSRPQSFGGYDGSAPESSSQSSSADNGDPQTPSPHYSEAVPATSGHVIATHESDDEVMYPQEMDPHFARLLNSLSLSAAAPKGDVQPKPKPESVDLKPSIVPPVSKTPVPRSTSPTASKFLPAQTTSRTARVVGHAADVSPLKSPPSTSLNGSNSSSAGSSKPLVTSPRSFRSTQAPIREPPATGEHAQSSPSHALSSPPSGSLSAASVSSISSPSSQSPARKPSMSSRRSSSTADISPYLTRPTEVPTSGKRLKQLALLETVADESSRMTPIVNSHDLPRTNSAYGFSFASARHPGPSASVPPPSSFSTGEGPLADFQVIYGSGPSRQGPPFMPGPSHALGTNAPQHAPVADDPFQVRPRSSQFNPLPAYAPRYERPSMPQQTQLLSLLSGPLGSGFPTGPPHAHLQPHPAMGFPTLHPYHPPTPLDSLPQNYSQVHPAAHYGRLPAGPLPMFHAPSQYAGGSTSALASAPNLAPSSPNATRMPPSGSTQLLSILNGNKPVAAPPMPGMPINAGHR